MVGLVGFSKWCEREIWWWEWMQCNHCYHTNTNWMIYIPLDIYSYIHLNKLHALFPFHWLLYTEFLSDDGFSISDKQFVYSLSLMGTCLWKKIQSESGKNAFLVESAITPYVYNDHLHINNTYYGQQIVYHSLMFLIYSTYYQPLNIYIQELELFFFRVFWY